MRLVALAARQHGLLLRERGYHRRQLPHIRSAEQAIGLGQTFAATTSVAATDVRPKITMACQECKHRNYITKKNRRNDPDRLEMKKFCPNCRSHTLHRETR